jgi:hypothetical protein
MIGRKIAAVALGVAAMVLTVAPAGAQEVQQTIERPCYQNTAMATVPQWTHIRITPRRAHFTVTATNTNEATPGGAFDARLVVTYQRSAVDFYQGPPRTILAATVPNGGTFTASFSVAKLRIGPGAVFARIVDVLCDGANETVSLA